MPSMTLVWPSGLIGQLRVAVARRNMQKALAALPDQELAEAVRRIRAVAGKTTATRSGRALVEEALEDVESEHQQFVEVDGDPAAGDSGQLEA